MVERVERAGPAGGRAVMVERVERAGPAGGRRGRGAVRAGAAAGGGAGERGEKMKTEMANATARTVGFTVPRPAPARAHTLPPQPCATLPPPRATLSTGQAGLGTGRILLLSPLPPDHLR